MLSGWLSAYRTKPRDTSALTLGDLESVGEVGAGHFETHREVAVLGVPALLGHLGLEGVGLVAGSAIAGLGPGGVVVGHDPLAHDRPAPRRAGHHALVLEHAER